MTTRKRLHHRRRLRVLLLILLLLALVAGCGDGWDEYKEFYEQNEGQPPGEAWEGDETVFVVLGGTTVETPLAGIETSEFNGVGAIRLSDLILASGITAHPDGYRYDFTASDGYNLLEKRDGRIDQLPDWENMGHGFLYLTSYGDLQVGWEEHPWGSAVSAYCVKYMNGGRIELLHGSL